MRFGLAGSELELRRVPELAPLPSRTSPVVVYMGQTKDEEAAFLVSADVVPSGGRCSPDPKVCSTLYLKVGETVSLTVSTTAGKEIRYAMQFVKRVVSEPARPAR